MPTPNTKTSDTKTTVRFDHSNCKHPTSGAEGKKARAACRKLHAEQAKKKTTTTRKKATPAKVAASVSKPSTVKEMEIGPDDLTADL